VTTFTSVDAARAFALGGNARLTLSSLRTGARYTYRVAATRDAPGQKSGFFVSLLTGADNEADYTYIGMLRGGKFVMTQASKLPHASAPVQAFSYFWKHVGLGDAIPPQLEVRHEGRCGRCARVLTVPESIDSGFGPECRGRLACS